MAFQTTQILVADDEANIRLMVRTALEADGYHVKEAADGNEALAAIANTQTSLLVLDLSMPVLDGMGVLAEIKNLPAAARPKVLILTAYGSIAAAVKAMRLGAQDFIEKPLTPEELRSAVERVLAGPSEGASAPQAAASYDEVLMAVRTSLREGRLADAGSWLMQASAITAHDAEFLNLAGIFHEAAGRKDAARSFYGKAIRANHNFTPAQQNMRRLFELERFGHTNQIVAVGDEPYVVQPNVARSAKSLKQRLAALLKLAG